MNTTALHLKVQRSRFNQHALATLASIAPQALRNWLTSAPAELSASDKASKEAQTVRDLASTYAKTDPGFAADLYAAAARHETLHG